MTPKFFRVSLLLKLTDLDDTEIEFIKEIDDISDSRIRRSNDVTVEEMRESTTIDEIECVCFASQILENLLNGDETLMVGDITIENISVEKV